MNKISCSLLICLLAIVYPYLTAQASSTMVANTYTNSDQGLQIGKVVTIASHKALREYKLCAVLPNMKDSYWKLVIEGIKEQIKYAEVDYNIFQASGYEAISQQVGVVEKRCLNMGFDAILLSAVSKDGFNAIIEKSVARGIPVIDLVNGVTTKKVSAKSLVPFKFMGLKTAELVNKTFPEGANILWFPGPKGPEWSEAADIAFRERVSADNIKILKTDYTETFLRKQVVAIREALGSYKDIDAIVGTASTIEAAIKNMAEIKERGIKLFSYYYNPMIRPAVKCSEVSAAVFDDPKLQGRLAVDQAVRLLDGVQVHRLIGPKVTVLTADNLHLYTKSHNNETGKTATQDCNR